MVGQVRVGHGRATQAKQGRAEQGSVGQGKAGQNKTEGGHNKQEERGQNRANAKTTGKDETRQCMNKSCKGAMREK